MLEKFRKLNEIIKRERMKQLLKNPEIANILKLSEEAVSASLETEGDVKCQKE